MSEKIAEGASVSREISVIDLASELGKRKQTIFKVITRLGIATRKIPDRSRRGASVAYVSHSDAERIQR